MKIALCLSGLPRNLNKAYPNIKQQLLDPYLPDVFIHTWYNKEDIGVPLFNSWGQKIEEQLDNFVLSNIFEKFNPKKLLVENQIDFDLPKKLNFPEYGFNMVSMLYSINEANNLKKRYEEENNFIYDIVIRYRFDLNIFGNLDLFSLDLDNKIYCLKECPHFNGVNDQFAVGSSQNIDVFSSSLNIIPELWNMYQFFGIESVCGETVVYYNTWLKNQIEINILPNDYNLLRS